MEASCMYCKRTYDKRPGEGISHGVCPSCAKVAMSDLDLTIEQIQAIAALKLPACQRAAGL